MRFNHGDGWVIGHQWTNIVLVINNDVIPLPPIPFYTKKYCRKHGLKYKKESERILDFLATTDWNNLLPGVSEKEIVVLMDSGYDNKKLQTFIQFQGWSFVVSLKSQRGVSTETQTVQSVTDLFRLTRKIGPWKTIRMIGGKRKEFPCGTLLAYLKDVPFRVQTVCSEKPNEKRLFLACSLEKVSTTVIARTYKLRWKVEIFHKEVKSYLGLENAGLTRFEAIEAHLYWVYVTYLLLFDLSDKEGQTILSRCREVRAHLESEKIGYVLKLNSRMDRVDAIREYCFRLRKKLYAA